ncbi:putative multiple-sugar transport system permease YteP [Spirochaetia bacterium]|nr:putative multiple-sugar transport system permease YteP [Spirochaetia bacterium]GHU31471.1 putative multiple-sugar transport system permease YteP [Spirochaetia bacterium]
MKQLKRSSGNWVLDELLHYKGLYFMLIPVVAYYVIFCYVPMYGVQMAFRDFSPRLGITGSPWAGLRHFREFFGSIYFVRLLRNTILINFYGLIFGFPVPIIFAILLNELRLKKFKGFVQTVSYLPHFVSIVVIAGIIKSFTATDGLFSVLGSQWFSFPKQNMLMIPDYFRSIYVISDIWQEMGWSSIIYIAALSGINSELYEAAEVDGAGRFRQIWHVTLPGLIPIIMTMLVLRIGSMLFLGFEKVFLLYNEGIYETADVISTYVYRKGLIDGSFSFSTAVGLFNSVVNMVLLVSANRISKRLTQQSLW